MATAGALASSRLPVASGIYAENNFFRTVTSVTPDQFIAAFTGGRSIFVAGTMHTGTVDDKDVDPLADYNAVRNPDLAGTVGWEPTAVRWFDATRRIPAFVELHAGPFKW